VLVGRVGIAHIISQPRHLKGVSGQHHAPVALYPQEKNPSTIVQEAGRASEPVWTQRLEEKSSPSVRDRIPVVQPVVRHYID
jgi:hypothetical protein